MIFLRTRDLTRTAMIAAVYTAVSLALAPISFGSIQIRIAEALTILPLIYEPAIFGVTAGCFLTNLIGAATGVNPTGFLDAFVGTLATFLAAECTYHFRERRYRGIPVLSILMPVVFNFVFVGIELGVLLFPDNVVMGSLLCGAEVAVGELIAAVLGYFLCRFLARRKIFEN